MVMQTQQLKYGDYNGPRRWPPSSPFQKAVSSRTSPFLPRSNARGTQSLCFPLVHARQAETQLPGFDSGTARTERLSRKSETAFSELLQLPASSEMVLSFAARLGLGVGKAFHSGDFAAWS